LHAAIRQFALKRLNKIRLVTDMLPESTARAEPEPIVLEGESIKWLSSSGRAT
jgi:hypothetical protein